jgi:type VI secretion system protein ImpK
VSDATAHTRVPSVSPASPIPSPSSDYSGLGLSPLVRAASPLLLLAGQLRGTLSAPDVGALRRHAMDEIRRFEERARAAGIPNEVILSARYALCAGVDEAVLSTPWGSQSEWRQQSLLVALHREAWGGEKFFEMLDRVSEDPARHIALMELQYLCLALGFAGKFHVKEGGRDRLDSIRHDVYRKIRGLRGQSRPELSARWRGVEDQRHRIVRYVPWWVVGAAALAVLAIAYTFYAASLNRATSPVKTQLAGLGPIASVASVVTTGPRLRLLLAADEREGTLEIEEEGGVTRVRLLATDLFGSGSATVNPSREAALRRIGAALEQVPGSIRVEGHTDDQPIYSFRFRDNFELSRERAVSVATILQTELTNPGRITWRGVGSLEQRFGPDTPNYRARNRRVEILHVP